MSVIFAMDDDFKFHLDIRTGYGASTSFFYVPVKGINKVLLAGFNWHRCKGYILFQFLSGPL